MTVKDELERARERAAADQQPSLLEELRREFPPELGFTVEQGEHFEVVDGELRIVPIVAVEWPEGRQQVVFYPESPKRPP